MAPFVPILSFMKKTARRTASERCGAQGVYGSPASKCISMVPK